MIYRLYYWYKNAPADRPGGPWWYKDFKTVKERLDFLICIKLFICKYARINFENNFENIIKYRHNPLEIKPPKECQIIKINRR